MADDAVHLDLSCASLFQVGQGVRVLRVHRSLLVERTTWFAGLREGGLCILNPCMLQMQGEGHRTVVGMQRIMSLLCLELPFARSCRRRADVLIITGGREVVMLLRARHFALKTSRRLGYGNPFYEWWMEKQHLFWIPHNPSASPLNELNLSLSS